MSRVYVIIPVFNRLAQTKECLDSLFRQSYRDLEIVVIDSNSTDGTTDYLKQYYPEIKMVTGRSDWWWTKSIAEGVKTILSSVEPNDFVLLLNNDCYIESSYVMTIVKESLANNRSIIGSVVFDAKSKLARDGGVSLDWKEGFVKNLLIKENRKKNNFESDTLSGKGTLIPIEVFKAIGNFNYGRLPHYLGDYEFFCRAKRHGFCLLVSTKIKVYNYFLMTGKEGLSEDFSLAEFFFMLFNRKSKINIVDWTNFVLLTCPKKYWIKNLVLRPIDKCVKIVVERLS
jgi:GT2 family glycosyltransferase